MPNKPPHQQPHQAPHRQPTGHAYSNRLIDSANPYLLLHAHNPVDWYPWGDEALARARSEDKPIFLSVGYSTCYWCHVAERLIYADPDIAALMNRWFINIKVDREQYPDIDHLYMLATELIAGHGGWPNNVFLNHELKPFYAGSYFPPRDAGERPGFGRVLAQLHQAWLQQRPQLNAYAELIYDALRDYGEQRSPAPARVTPQTWLTRLVAATSAVGDRRLGGYSSGDGSGPKFPQPPLLLALLQSDANGTLPGGDRQLLQTTLNAMALGGLCDQLAGGFHRYSTDAQWSVPHFEKMLYDNAQLLQVYARAHAQLNAPLYRHVAEQTAQYLLTDMCAEDGSFFTAQDAETDGCEGASYVWTEAQLRAALGADAEPLLELYQLAPLPPDPVATGHTALAAGAGVLRLRPELLSDGSSEAQQQLLARLAAVAPLRERLLALRNRRPQPLRDDKRITAFNALTIIGLCEAAQALDSAQYRHAARRAATAIWASAFEPQSGELHHAVFRGHAQTPGYLDDYALLGQAMLALLDADGDPQWLQRAALLADALLARFRDRDGRLRCNADAAALPVVPRDSGDQTQPSGTSAAIGLLLALAAIGGNRRYLDAALQALRHVAAEVERQPLAWPSLVTALVRHAPASSLSLTPAPAAARASADVLTVNAALTDKGERLRLELDIAEGYYLRADTTTVRLADRTAKALHKPPAQQRRDPFSDEGKMAVYSGKVVIEVELDAPASATQGELSAQVCSEAACLAPSVLRFAVGR